MPSDTQIPRRPRPYSLNPPPTPAIFPLFAPFPPHFDYTSLKVGESMADEKTVRGMKAARTEFSKRGIETGRADIRMTHGTIYVRGVVSVMRGSDHQGPEVRDGDRRTCPSTKIGNQGRRD